MSALYLSVIAVYSLFLSSCYRQQSPTPDGWVPTEEQIDSISFYTTHHYSQNYNFLVTADSLQLIVQQPEEYVSGLYVDTISVYQGERLVVADILMIPTDTVDSVWVQVARDQNTIAWSHETALLAAVTPDNPISLFIDFFSDTHLLIMLAVVVLCLALFEVRRLYRRHAMIVHLRDIDSFYPTLLALLVAASAVFYSTIQLVNPESWRHFYYHPTLNPFGLPLILSLFLCSVWVLLVLTLATIEEVFRLLPTGEAMLYLLSLLGCCILCYLLFTLAALSPGVSYILFALFILVLMLRYNRYSKPRYFCGSCGKRLKQLGKCPHCGAENR